MVSSDINSCPAQPHINLKRWWTHRNLRTLNLLMIVPLFTSFTQGFDGSMFGSLQAVDAWQDFFNHPMGSQLATLGAAPTIASFVGVFMLPFVGDRLGRKWSMFGGAAFIVLGAALQAASMNLAMYGVARAFIGFGTVFCQASGIAWTVEIAHPRQRATASAIFFTSYSVGSVIAAWVIYGTVRIAGNASWRIPSALQAAPAVMQLMIIKYHSEGVDDDLAQWEFEEIAIAIEAERTLVKGFFKPVRDAFSTKGNRKRMFCIIWASICSQASGNSFISYYFSPVLRSIGITSELEQTLINATSQILSWFSALGFAFLPGRVGRRPLFLTSLTLLLGVVVGITAASASYANDNNNKSASYAVVALVYLFSPAYNLGFNGNLTTFMGEILSFHTRIPGLALYQLTGNCVQLIFSYATPIGLENIGWKYFIVHIPWIVIEIIVVYLVFPETKGYGLEEISVLFDGPDATVTPETVKIGHALERTESTEKATEEKLEQV